MKIHIVKSGDTLYELSKKYDIPLQKIIDANPQISDPNELKIGQKVKIPSEPVQVPSNDQIIHKHVVKQGDSLWKLSKAWGVSLKEMIDANPQLKNPNALLVGEVVNIPKTSGSQNSNENANTNANANVNAHPDKVLPGGKAYTGPKEEMTSPTSIEPPQQLPELPNLPNIMPEMMLPNLPNVMPNTSNVMPEANVMPEMTMPNIMPNVMPEMTMPNVMPEMTMPNMKPNIMPATENKPMAVLPIAEEPWGCDDKYSVGSAHHPFMQFPTPAQEVGSFYSMPCGDELQAEHTYDNMPYSGKSSHYPGVVESAEDVDYLPNQSFVSPYAQAPGGGLGGHHWENHQSPVPYEPQMQSPASYHPNQHYQPSAVSPMYYEPVQAPYPPYNPCGCSGVSPAYHAPEPVYEEPMYYHPGGYPHFALPPWCYPYPGPMVSPYGTAPNSQHGAYGQEPNMPYHEANKPYHDPNGPLPGWGGMGYPHWDRTQAYAYPPQTAETVTEPTATVNMAQMPEASFHTVELDEKKEEPIKDSVQNVKTLSSSKNNSTTSREKSEPKKPKKQASSTKRKNPWIKG